jgi:non-ribosomal peptide synthetase component E (peptide arylation enzyme)
MPIALPRTFWRLIVEHADRDPDQVVLADDYGRTLTRAQLRDEAERVAAALASRGVGSGTVVSWQLPTTLEALVLLVALARLGAMQNPIIPILRQREVGFITRQVGTELFVGPGTWRGFDYTAMVREAADGRAIDVLELDLEHLDRDPTRLQLPVGDPATLPAPPTDDGVRWLYYSSGTTADPKGARHTDTSIMSASFGMLAGVRFDERDVYPVAWPVAHIGGSTMLTTTYVSGTRLVLFDRFDAATTPERMAAHRPTLLGTAVPFFRAFLDAQMRHGDEPLFPALRAGAFGGAPLPAEIHVEMRATFGVNLIGSWGLTEFPISTSAHADDPPGVLESTVGRLSPGVSLRVVGTDEREVAPGGEGELRLKGPQCCVGYVDAALDADGFDADGWFRTGDLGSIDADGNVRITGRLKDIVIRNAENISVLEIEELLFRHPAVADASVLGLPDVRTGERVCAVVVLRPGATLDLVGLRAFCDAEGLARQKCPEQLEIVDLLPRNPMGKVVKPELRTRLA